MTKRLRPLILSLLVLFISGCAHVVPKNLREQADPALTFRQVSQHPSQYKEKIVIWGGDIIETVNQKDGTTLIEVFQRPLGWREEPKETVASEGRFLILTKKYLDPYLFRRGRKITVVGEILGEEIRPIGKMDYRYPLLSNQAALPVGGVLLLPCLLFPLLLRPLVGLPLRVGTTLRVAILLSSSPLTRSINKQGIHACRTGRALSPIGSRLCLTETYGSVIFSIIED